MPTITLMQAHEVGQAFHRDGWVYAPTEMAVLPSPEPWNPTWNPRAVLPVGLAELTVPAPRRI
jgi:hypothetical protein